MGNDIEIRVQARADLGGLTTVNTSLRTLRSNANQAGQALSGLAGRAAAATAALRALNGATEDVNRSLRTLRGRAAATAAALGDLRTAGTGTNTTLRTLSSRAQTADGRLQSLNNRTGALRDGMTELDAIVGTLTGRLGGLRAGLGQLPGVTVRSGDGMQGLRAAAISLSPALIPIAAAGAPIAAGLGAATVATIGFGLAIGGQISKISKASEAQKAYEKALREHGRGSEQAAKADQEYQRTLADMPPATRRAAAALSLMKDEYKAWTDALSADTMPVATKSFAAFGALLPRLSPLVRGTSAELDRLMTVMAGGIQSSGFERFMESFAGFAEGALAKATDGLISFSQAMAGGAGSGAFAEFMAYAREVGPAVGETLGNLAQAMVHLVASASELGVSVLSAVNALAGLVNAIPGDAIATFLQFALAFKAVQLAAAGFAAVGGLMAAFRTQVMAAGTAAIGASGAMGTLAAAFGALSRGAKLALIGSGIGLLVVALTELSEIGQKAPVDLEKMTSSVARLGRDGKLGGEAARMLGKDFGLLEESVRTLTRPSNRQALQQFLIGWTGWDSTPVKESKKHIDALDKSLAELVRGGNADLAEAAFKRAGKSLGNLTPKELRSKLDDYKNALADARLEAELTADAMGLFGQQALEVQGKLDAQKASADGLRQAITALNDVHRAGLEGQSGFEAAIDAMGKAARKNAGSLRMLNGELDLTSEKARTSESAMRDVAAKTEEYANAARASGSSWEKVNGIYERGRSQLLKQAEAFGLSKSQARSYVNSILEIPKDRTTRIKMRSEDAIAGLNSFIAAVRRAPNAKSVTVRALTKDAINQLEGLGYTVKRLPDGRFKVTAETGTAMANLGAVKRARDAIQSKSITITTTTIRRTVWENVKKGGGSNQAAKNAAETSANGNIFRSFANGSERHVAEIAAPTFRLWAEPETGGEAYIPLAESKRPRSLAILEQVADEFGYGLEKFAKGGVSKSERKARNDARSELTISRYGQMAGYQRSEFGAALGRPDSLSALVTALSQWRSIIMKATSGGTEKSLLRQLDSTAKGLIRYEKALGRLSDQYGKAKDKLSDLRNAASQLSSGIKNNVLGAANITRGASGDGQVTTAGIMGGLVASRDKSAAFAQALKDLQKKGLSKDLLRQVAEAGIDGGGLETATALLGASSSEIQSMNNFQSQIAKAAGTAGKTVSNALYGSQIDAQEKLVKSLKGQQEKLEKAMDRLTKAMEKAVEKAFGQKASGGVVGSAATGGIRSGLTWVGEQGPELVGLPIGSRVYPAGQSRRMADGAGTPDRPIVIELKIGDKAFGELWVQTGRREVRARGGDIKATLKTR
ncbi:phage tail protein [Streptomyces jumonjinensis]|uniref:phage tail protein n=1 Tax=Streptomyces jumonjinensis TaxID=1945 RepID=UPI0037B5F0B4